MVSDDVVYLALGVGLTTLGSILSAFGYVIQKKGHIAVIEMNEIHEIQDEAVDSYSSNKTWAAGFIIGMTGSIITAAALKFGAQSVLAPLSALILVCNALFATKILGESFEKHHLYGIILVIIGSIMAVYFGPKSTSAPISLSYIESCWRSIYFLIFFIGLTLICIIDYVLVKIYEHKNWKAMDNHNITHGGNFLMISYVSLASYFGSTNVLFMKSAVIVIGSFQVSYFTDYVLYITIFGIILVNVLLEYFRQRALVYFDASYVVPIFQVLLILGSTIFGAIFFSEFALLSDIELLIFMISVFMTLLGVAILAYDVGAMYKKVLKVLDDNTPKAISFTKDQPPLSVRSRRRKSFSKRSHKQQHLVFPAFHGINNYVAAHVYLNTPRFVFNDTLPDIITMKSGNINLEVIRQSPGTLDKPDPMEQMRTFSFVEDVEEVPSTQSVAHAKQTNTDNDNNNNNEDNVNNQDDEDEIHINLDEDRLHSPVPNNEQTLDTFDVEQEQDIEVISEDNKDKAFID